jgi:hypothetical protein
MSSFSKYATLALLLLTSLSSAVPLDVSKRGMFSAFLFLYDIVDFASYGISSEVRSNEAMPDEH